VIDRTVADEFAHKLAERAGSLKVGDPREQETQIGPLVNADAVERVTGPRRGRRRQGREGDLGRESDGLYFEPTVVTNVSPEMRVYSEEAFGPIVAIVPVDGVDEAVRVANDTEYGLSAAVFSRNVDAALSVAARLHTGMCHINDATVNDEPQCHSEASRTSGWGRFGGDAHSRSSPSLRWITIQDSPRKYAI